jgi:4-amino-4-deoxy-L-arabinose transferase-like glycosyltransferase
VVDALHSDVKLVGIARITRIRGACAVLIAIVAFSALFVLFTRGNDFPLYWHPDEESKVWQIQNLNFNFTHPQLMLCATIAAKHLLGIGNDAVEVGRLGRIVSAAAAASAIMLLALFTYRRQGVVASLMVLVLLALSPVIFITAHYFKEDATLLFGTAAALVAFQQVERLPTMINSALVGIAVSFAASGKYIGILMIVPALAILFTSGIKLWDYALAGVSFIAGCLAWNIPAILHPSQMIAGLSTEITHVATNHEGISTGFLSWTALIYLWASLPTILLGLFMVYILVVLLGRERRPVTDYVVALFPLVLLLLIQISMVKSPRYLVPVIALSVVGAVCVSAEMFAAARGHVARMLAALPLVAGVGSSAVMFAVTAATYFDDPRDRLAQWLKTNLPPNAVVIADWYAGLPNTDRTALDPSRPALPQRVLNGYLEKAGSLGALRSQGVTHIVAAGQNFDRYFDPNNILLTAESQKVKELYAELFAGSDPLVVFKATSFSAYFVSPDLLSELFLSSELRVYELPPEGLSGNHRTVKSPSG